eukprot:CAMPEP_0197682372 /NCGR_PEP_ID=MMETSP1338-20131121/96366_1 /TAXON_ID=43686 ORGANISM="Pelagodinium beii, Strain RCC1491" /NCGR_SAMPLE_ID=MMETSP1338 /ASSEMBLY_ACC=CAM_ASM_000754 /LENGTH=64 /DNA_ID=CAMNT_0043263827 /DNA_START=233 /DNA_END=423 /DNA_ORIENTATION=-
MAYLLVAEAKMPLGEDGYRYSGMAMNMVDDLGDMVKPLLMETSFWPYREAIARLEQTANWTQQA